MTGDEIKRKIESSFSPYRCVAQLHPESYGTMIGFRVYDNNDEEIITIPNVSVSKISSVESLSVLIDATKDNIRGKGFLID